MALSLLAIPIASLTCAKVKTMTQNETYLDEFRTNAEEFQNTREPEHLREAYAALENVSLAEEQNPKTRSKLRKNTLSLWLGLLQILDDHLDAKFDPEDGPELLVEPPAIPGGVILRPGADPAKIKDPTLRAQYERAIAANRAKANNYRLQIHLGRLDERITPRAEEFIRNSYTKDPEDQEELKTGIETTIKDPKRKESLLKLLAPPQPKSDESSP